MMGPMKPNRWLALMLLLVTAVAVSAAARRVERDKVTVMSGPGSFYARAGELSRGTEVEVVGEKGSWLEVRAGDVKGFVPRSAFEEKKGGGLASLGHSMGSSEASATSETAGVKGFNPDVEKAHAKRRGLDWSGVDKLERQKVTAEEVRTFLAKRGLGEGEVKK